MATSLAGKLVVLCLGGVACRPVPEPPARIVGGRGDTVVVNNRRAVRLPVRVLDASGREMPDTAVRFAPVSASTIPVSERGEVTCVRADDTWVRATVDRVTSEILVRCRPVEAVRFSGPVRLIVGGGARAVPVTAYGPDGRVVGLIAARLKVVDTTIVDLDGMLARPRRWGATPLTVLIGDRRASAGVHVYEPATSLDGLWKERRFLAVPLRLAPGETRRWSLPPGGWLLSIWGDENPRDRPLLRVEGAQCDQWNGLGDGYIHCNAGDRTSVIAYAPWAQGRSRSFVGTLTVKPDGGTIAARSRAPDGNPRLPNR